MNQSWFQQIPTEDMIRWRRHIHQNPELSFKEYNTSAYVEETLRSFGNIEIEHPTETSVLAIIHGAQKGKTMLLRADMDALPMQEESGLPFASTVKNVAHTCGHDTHTAMLLATAKVLNEMRDTLHGTVKLIFQLAEELNTGVHRRLLKVDTLTMLMRLSGCISFQIFPAEASMSIPVVQQQQRRMVSSCIFRERGATDPCRKTALIRLL